MIGPSILQDVDEDEVAELISSSCLKNITAQLIVPMLPARRMNNQQTDLPKMEQLHVQMERSQFKYDITWFSQHFHELDQVRELTRNNRALRKKVQFIHA